MKMIAALLIVAAAAVPARASEFEDFLTRARKGDYQAQRNVAYMLERGDGGPQNRLEACAWRFVILATQGVQVGDTDLMIDDRCGEQTLRQSALARTSALLAILPKPPLRTVEADVAAITDGECPGSRCVGPLKEFADDYRRAVTGETSAMRAVASCFEAGCMRPGAADFFKACLWATQSVASSPEGSRDDRARVARTCNTLSAFGKAAIKPHLAMIDAMRMIPTRRANPPAPAR